MSASVILSILTLYTSGFLFIFAGLEVLKKFRNTPSERFFGLSIFLMGLILGPLMGTRTIFGIKGYHDIDFFIAIFDQIPLILSLFSLGMYFAYKSFQKRDRKAIKILSGVLAIILSGVLINALINNAYAGPHISKWGTEYEPTGMSKVAFLGVWVILVLLNITFLIKRIWRKIKEKKERFNYDFYVGVIMMTFLGVFVLEELGEMNTWKLVFFRVAINAIAVSLFLLYSKEEFNEDNITK